MDILTFRVGDIQVGLPLNLLALSVPITGARLSVDQAGAGSLEATFRVVDLRRKLGFPVSTSEHDIRLIMVTVDHHLIGVIINTASQAVIVQDVIVEPSSGIDTLCVLGTTTYNGDQVFVFDWNALLASDVVLDLNEMFSQPVFTQTLPPEARFLEAAMRMVEDGQALTQDQVRSLARSFDLPLSVASRLITFYTMS